jgi:hypothetical protein
MEESGLSAKQDSIQIFLRYLGHMIGPQLVDAKAVKITYFFTRELRACSVAGHDGGWISL